MVDLSPTHRLDTQLVTPIQVSPLIFALCILIGVDYFRGTLYLSSTIPVGILVGFLVIFGLSHFIPKLKFGQLHGLYLVLYHVVLGLALIFILPVLSYYLFLWILLLYLGEYYYQAKGMLASLAVLLVVLVAGSAYQLHGFSSTSILMILPYFMVLTAITLVLTRIVLGGRRERLSLNEKIVKTEYEHERLVALINSMSEAVIATDEAGKITIYNAAALDLLDTNSELTGKLISECLRLTDGTKKSVDIMQVAKQTRYILRRTDLMLPVNDTDQMALDINISRVSMTAAIVKQEGYTFLMRDITAQKSLDEERDLFISEVSHELRTPITIAEANISMANLQATKPDRDEDALVGSIDKAHKQVLFLADMVNDLSTLSRASRDDKSMDVDTFSIREIILELARTYAPQADKKGLYLKANVEFKLPEVTSSKLYLKEILQNFVTNAIKYTKEGGITVRAYAHNEQTLAITIHDTGIGISKSEITKVFEKFWRSEDPYTRQTSGTGLGLYITSKLAGRIGAEITVESTVGEGTTFGILLPVIAVKTVDQKKVANDQVAHIFE